MRVFGFEVKRTAVEPRLSVQACQYVDVFGAKSQGRAYMCEVWVASLR